MTICRCLAFALAAVVAAGCGRANAPKPTTNAAAKGDPHPTAGPHGGPLIEWGDEEYHVELLIDAKAKEATAYVLDESAMKAKPIAATTLTLELKLEPPVAVTLSAKPEAGDPAGQSSRFTGAHDVLGQDKLFEGSVSGTVGATPYSGKFKQKKAHARHGGMPEGVGGTPEEKTLFLSPGGIYTAADIRANGSVVPSEKFKGISWPHDESKPGDRICPVTANKADDRCEWIVNGKSYTFCCTPCLDKFVKWAKQTPEKVKEPGDYVQK